MWPEPKAQGHIDRSEGLERGGDFPLCLSCSIIEVL
jgi:hypothetical protein